MGQVISWSQHSPKAQAAEDPYGLCLANIQLIRPLLPIQQKHPEPQSDNLTF